MTPNPWLVGFTAAVVAAVALLDNIRRRVARDRKAARERYEVPAAS